VIVVGAKGSGKSTLIRHIAHGRWIPDFTEKEAKLYLTKVGFTGDEETRTMVIDMIGTRPSFMRDIGKSEMNLNEFIERQIVDNENSILNCLKLDSRYENILVKMMRKTMV
jgi:GTPase SAR1 family protein